MKSSTSKRKRARQTRLNFTPVASSSPGAAHLSPQVRDRAAAVSFDGSPGPVKKRRIDSGAVEEITDNFKTLPTPLKSSQPRPNQQNISTSKQLQRQLDFGGNKTDEAPSRGRVDEMGSTASRPRDSRMSTNSDGQMLDPFTSSSSSDAEELPRKHMPGSWDKATKPRSTKPTAIPVSSDEDEVPKELNTRSRADQKVATVYPPTIEDPPNSSPVARRSTRRSNKHQKSVVISSDETPESLVQPRHSAQKQPVEFESESSGEDMPDSSPLKKPRSAGKNRRRQRSNSFEVPDDVVDTEDDDEPVVSPRKRNKRWRPHNTDEDDEDEVVPTPRMRARHQLSASSTEEDDDDIVSTRRRRTQKTPKKTFTRQEQEDLDEDLEFLGSSRNLSNKARGKLATPKKMSARDIALEKLRRRRAGEDDDISDTPPRIAARTINNVSSSEEEAEEDDGLQDMELGGPLHRSDVLDMFHEDEDDDGFVVDEDEDGDDTIGAPDMQIPLEFTALARAKAKDLFKYAIDWMVQKKINPAFERKDEVYQLAFQKLDDEVKGLAGSKFVSSVWRPEFTRAIRARPEIDIMETRGDAMSQDCQACNRRNHPATWSIRLYGNPYHPESLEDITESDDSDNPDDDDKSYDRDGNALPDENRWFSVGSTCKLNAEMAHVLHHWRWNLNTYVVDYLNNNGHCTADKLLERETLSERKRRKAADKIVDRMEEKGEIKSLYKVYRSQLDYAQDAKHDRSRFVRR